MLNNINLFFVALLQENHLGGGEEDEHGNIWRARPLPARPRLQGPGPPRAERRRAPPQNC